MFQSMRILPRCMDEEYYSEICVLQWSSIHKRQSYSRSDFQRPIEGIEAIIS